FNETSTSEIYTLSLHDALPISLARMIQLDEDALICDLAETYQIYDYRQLPPTRVAVFSIGLRDDSRIKMKASGQLVPMETLLLRSEEHTSELQSRFDLVCRLLL